MACYCEERRESNKKYEKNRRIRRFNNKWRELNPWLEYDEVHDVMFCSWCRKEGITGMGKTSNSFYKGTNSFRTSSILSHVQSKNHHQAVARRYAKGAVQDAESMDSSTGVAGSEHTMVEESSLAAVPPGLEEFVPDVKEHGLDDEPDPMDKSADQE